MTKTTARTVTLGTTTFAITVEQYGPTGRYGDQMTFLTGPRGAVYFLRPFRGDDDGLRQIVSCKTGMPLRVRGNEVHVHHLGDIIELA